MSPVFVYFGVRIVGKLEGENVTVPSTASVVDLKRAAQEVLGSLGNL